MLSIMDRIARTMAVIGGGVLVALVLLVCISVSGRRLNTLGHSEWFAWISQTMADALVATGVRPITGDFEILEAGVAFAIFSFLPICQLYGAHATVDIFTNGLPSKINRWIVIFWEFVLTAVIILITWRLFAGMQSKLSNGETTFLLQFPIWWAYAASFAAAVVASLVGAYTAFARVAEAVTGRKYLPYSEGAIH
ncbi:MAG: TRAP transporter small permease subunit [Phaeobacter gallaeciensis]